MVCMGDRASSRTTNGLYGGQGFQSDDYWSVWGTGLPVGQLMVCMGDRASSRTTTGLYIWGTGLS